MAITSKLADYTNSDDAAQLLDLLNVYATDSMGGGKALASHVQENLTEALAKVPGAFTVLMYVDGKPAGLANCFQGFSTFKCKPLINIHDLAVKPEFRGLGLSQRLLSEVETVALSRGCCKVTLEVLTGNEVAKNSYIKFGFSGYELDPEAGHAVFWEKTL